MSALLQWIDDAGDAVSLDIDVATTVNYERSAEVTEHPVEDGSPTADHIRIVNGIFSLEGVISDTPVRVPRSHTRGLARAVGNVELRVGNDTVRVQLQRWSGPLERKRACNDALAELVGRRYKVTLTTSLEEVTNLAVTRFHVTEDVEAGNALKLQIEFKQLRFAQTARAAVPAIPRARPVAPRGPQPPEPLRSTIAAQQDGGAAPTDAQRRAAEEHARRYGGN